MSVFLDPVRLSQGLGRAIHHKILPALQEGTSARFNAIAMHELLIHEWHRRSNHSPLPTKVDARSMAQRIAELTEGTLDREKERDLVAILNADSLFYREDAAAWRAKVAQANAQREQTFSPPTEDELTKVVRKWSGDQKARARLLDIAVGGHSKQTILFDSIAHDGAVTPLVMRRDLPIGNLGPDEGATVIDEFPILKAIHQRGITVAEPLYLERDVAVLRTPFLISRRVPGRIRGTALGSDEEANFDSDQVFGTLLAQLHTLDVTELGLAGIPDARFDVETQRRRIAQWIKRYQQNIELPSAALDIGLAWLKANAAVVTDHSSLVHGDVGYHNMIFDKGKLTALVDWELVHVGSPAEDLAYVMPFVENFEKLLDVYVAQGGQRPSKAALAYCEVFAYVRNSIYGVICLRNFHKGDSDDIAMLRIILDSYYAYVDKLDQKLTILINEHSFIWKD